MLDKLTLFNIFLTLAVLIVVIMLINKLKEVKDSKPDIIVKPIYPHMRHRMAGCAKTRYGCCPNGRTPRANPRGTNC
jgi:hypothetical protein